MIWGLSSRRWGDALNQREIDGMRERTSFLRTTLALGAMLSASTAFAAAAAGAPDVAGAHQRLRARAGQGTAVSVHPATGAARFVRIAPGSAGSLAPAGAGSGAARAQAFFQEYRDLFGIADARTELRAQDSRSDRLGMERITYEQFYKGIPVFAGLLRAHFARDGRLVAANGVFVPGIDVPSRPALPAADAARTAMAAARVADPEKGALSGAPIRVIGSRLVVFRVGLVAG